MCILNLKINKRVSCGDTDKPIVVNESSSISDPYDDLEPDKSKEEVEEIMNYTTEVQRIPSCMGNGT